MQTQPSALVHIALALGQNASFLVPEAKVAIQLATAFAGMDALVEIFFPGAAPPPVATQAQMEQGFKNLADLIRGTAWLQDLQGHIATVRQAVVVHDGVFSDFTAGKYGATPIASLTPVLAADWQKMYHDVQSYGSISSNTALNPLLQVRDWVLNDALAYANGDPSKQKWIQFQLLPLYCSAMAAYISFCKLALMIQLHDALTTDGKGNPSPHSEILNDDFLMLVPSQYFENVDKALNGTQASGAAQATTGCIQYAHDTIAAYDQGAKDLQADIDWRKGRIAVQQHLDARTHQMAFFVRDDEADWTSVPYPDQATASTQLALYEASVLGPYATGRAEVRGVGGLSKADADGLRSLYQQPWDDLRRDLIKSRRAWAAAFPPPPKVPGT
jgi:hypothetical protein